MNERNLLGFKFKQIHDTFETIINKTLKIQGLTLSQIGILFYLFEQGEKTMTQKDIGRFFGLKHPTVNGLLRRMEHKGLVTILISAEDRRYKNIYPTDKAYQIRADMEKSQFEVDSILCHGLSEEDVFALSTVLDKILNNIANVK